MTPPFIDENPGTESVLEAVLSGLAGNPPTLPAWLFYDEEGSRLFDAITTLPEYYLTRAEVAILREHAGDMAGLVGSGATVVEYGSGSATKTDILLDALDGPEAYVPIDVSRSHLLAAASRIELRYPRLRVLPVCADYHRPIPRLAHALEGKQSHVFFPGSTIGNLEPEEACEFLRSAAGLVGSGGGLLIGFDLRKDVATLLRAYDDSSGVTAAFNRNMLVHVNRHLGPVFEPGQWRHRAAWNEEEGRIEMHLVTDRGAVVRVGEREFRFGAGDAIVTEYSYKYTRGDIDDLLAGSGFAVVRTWTGSDDAFAVVFARSEPF